MNVADALQGVKAIGLDAAPIVYFVEGHPVYHSLCVPFFAAINNGQVKAVTSAPAYTETLVKPLLNNDLTLTGMFRNVLSATKGLTTISVSIDLAEQAADLRARYRLKTPDAVHLATAIDSGCDAFLTNDGKLQRVTEIRVIVLDQLTL